MYVRVYICVYILRIHTHIYREACFVIAGSTENQQVHNYTINTVCNFKSPPTMTEIGRKITQCILYI